METLAEKAAEPTDAELTSIVKDASEWTPRKWAEMRRLYFTVRLPKVRGCGHKLDLSRDPRTGCSSCWFSYLRENGQIVQTADECFVKEGRETLERIRGKRFVKFFIKFMATIARFQQEEKDKA
jgi:hypothetical protein